MNISRFLKRKKAETLAHLQGRKHQKELIKLFPELEANKKLFSQLHNEIDPIYDYYINNVSLDFMAISKQSCVFLAYLCELFYFPNILELGSGLSSIILRKHSPDSHIVSVDTDRKWLNKTNKVLEGLTLPNKGLMLWEDFLKSTNQSYNLIYYDISNISRRIKYFEQVLSLLTPGGFLIIDDLHKHPLREQIFRTLSQKTETNYYNLHHFTKDQFSRYQGLIIVNS